MAEEEKKGGDDVAMPDAASAAPRFEIKKWNAVCMWSWDICADTCAICRNSLNEPSIEYQVGVSSRQRRARPSRSCDRVITRGRSRAQANPSPNNENGLSIAFGCCGREWRAGRLPPFRAQLSLGRDPSSSS